MTRLSATSRSQKSSGSIVSVLAVDCPSISFTIQTLPLSIVGVLSTPVIFFMLARRAGWIPAFCCLVWMLFTFLLPLPISKLQNHLWTRIMRYRDEILKHTSDLLSCVRLVKMYGWEDAYLRAMTRLRDKYLALVFLENALDGIVDAIFTASSSVMVIILFGTLSALNPTQVPSAELSFTCIYIISLTDMLTNATSHVLRIVSQVSVSTRRLIHFCTEEEQEHQLNTPIMSKHEGEVVLEKCSFVWSKTKEALIAPLLRSVSMDVAAGSFIGVVGLVGTGKSSLLAAILGEMECIRGTVRTKGRIGYVPQVPCLYNMTVRDNILFGQQFNPVRYDQVLRACELVNDINNFPAADLTEVGEKGETLSGGQKQRLALARAVYSDCSIYLLDDPLSALDPNVASRVFQQVVGKHGLLKNKTRILVANQEIFLQQTDQLLMLYGNRVVTYRGLLELSKDNRAPDTLRQSTLHTAWRPSSGQSDDALMLDKDESAGKVTTTEENLSSKGSVKSLFVALKMAGICTPIAVLFFAASGVSVAWQQVWIKQWVDYKPEMQLADTERHCWVRGLMALCLCDVFFRVAGATLLAASCWQLSRNVHLSMLSHVLHSPVSFFDSTPRGRILNRFSVDLEAVDMRLYLSTAKSIQSLIVTLARISVISTQAPPVALVATVSFGVFFVGMLVIVKASTEVRHEETTLVSRILQHVTETVDSLNVVRAFGVVDRFCAHFCRLADGTLRHSGCFLACFRVAHFLCTSCGLLVILTTLVFTVFFPILDSAAEHGASSVGVALGSALRISTTITTMCTVVFTMLEMTVGLKRVLEFTKLPPEESRGGADRKVNGELSCVVSPDNKWPTEGRLEFQNFSASYKPGSLPNVLRGVTFVAQPGEKVGVVGRTGAGKSSLVLAILRILEGTQGSISIDHVDVATVPLRRLRTAVTVIPQDPMLVQGSLRHNLDPTASHSDEELWKALEKTHMSEFVGKDINKLLLDVGESGTNLSVGQRQLVCLARALLREPRILVLDEATSQMDGDTDRLVQLILRKSFAGCTLIAIAHRIQTVLDYDKILVMGDGGVLEFGPVNRLLADPSSAFSGIARCAGVMAPPVNAASEACVASERKMS